MMNGLLYSTTEGQLTIDDVPMKCPAWCILDLRPLWMPAAVRGTDVLIPHSTGVLPRRRRRTVTTHTLPMIVTGMCDLLGDPPLAGHPDPDVARFAQLEENIDYLRSQVVDPTLIGDGTRDAVLTLPSGDQRTGPLHVLGMSISASVTHTLRCELTISVPYGVLT